MPSSRHLCLLLAMAALSLTSCRSRTSRARPVVPAPKPPAFQVMADRFADIQVLRYQVPGFEDLSLRQKKLAYYLYQAGLSGRDIFWDQRYGRNLLIRKTIEAVLETYSGERVGPEWDAFVTYARQVFFANGIHHHYSSAKFVPAFPAPYLAHLLGATDRKRLPLEGKSVAEFTALVTPLLFDPAIAPTNSNVDAGVDHVVASANNFYRGVTAEEVEAFYRERTVAAANPRATLGLNSQLAKVDGRIIERTWKVGGMYDGAITRMVGWLEKAVTVAESDEQKASLQHLIRFYRTGDIADFDRHCIAWVKDTTSRIDVVNGFIETYVDAIGKRGAYESIVSMRDEVATRRIATISAQAQWFEDRSPILPEHRKPNVTGISAKVITIIGEAGDAAPSTPIGINLPNAEWIRESVGSKSVSLGNIIASYNDWQSRSPAFDEFAPNPAVAARIRRWGPLAENLRVDMHEVIGHASGRLNPGVGAIDLTLKNYSSTIEEARADLVALYYILDPKLVEIGVMPSLEAGQALYEKFILNGLMMQLNRIKAGDNLQQAHMRNRQMVAAWVYAQGRAENVIEKIARDGKTSFRVNSHDKLRTLFGRLLREVQRIKSEGDYAAAQNLVETYGVTVDQPLLAEVHRRYETLNIAPYAGFIQPRLVPVTQGTEIVDVRVEYPSDFIGQMLEYGRDYSFLPVDN